MISVLTLLVFYLAKNKMIERISPNKTWEGFGGGVLFSFIISFAFAMIVSAGWTSNPTILKSSQWYYLLLISVMPLAANVGDLFFSASKRQLSLKDYGNIIAGHGGVLDRVDSLLVVGITVSLLLTFINNGWSLLL